MIDLNFDPNGVGLKNGNLIGLPFTEVTAKVILLPVPWDVTTSYRPGTSTGPSNILQASTQLDLADLDLKDAWKKGIYIRSINEKWLKLNNQLRPKAEQLIYFLEGGGNIEEDLKMQETISEINNHCIQIKNWVKAQTQELLAKGKLVGIVGGEHSAPLGFLEALSQLYDSFSVLQIDAHQDLRRAYEGFTYSHASIFYNALQLNNLNQLTQVGIRDWCGAEEALSESDNRITVFYDQNIKESQFAGKSFNIICQDIIDTLSEKVYISFDIDGLDPKLCPNTGTPVPGGLSYPEAMYLIKKVVQSGRKIIGFDLCEVAGEGNEWDGNVGSRVLFKLASWMIQSMGQ